MCEECNKLCGKRKWFSAVCLKSQEEVKELVNRNPEAKVVFCKTFKCYRVTGTTEPNQVTWLKGK